MKNILFVLVLCIIACVLAINPPNLAADEAPALNEEIINYVNSIGTTWKAGHNKRFSGMKMKEARRLLGVQETGSSFLAHTPSFPVSFVAEAEIAAPLPESFDARTQWPGCIGAIRDQGHCGDCWAFAAVESLSDRFCIGSGGKVKVVLSAQDLTSCDQTNFGCNGGILALAWLYLHTNGVVSEECLPFTSGVSGQTGTCNQTCHNTAIYKNDKHKSGLPQSFGTRKNATVIAQEILKNGPVETGFTVYEDFMTYQSGVYTHVTGKEEGGHAVKIIGWGTENGTPYWLVANSWGPDWGLDGFFKIRRGVDECGIEEDVWASSPVL